MFKLESSEQFDRFSITLVLTVALANSIIIGLYQVFRIGLYFGNKYTKATETDIISPYLKKK